MKAKKTRGDPQFPGARGPKTKKKNTTLFGMVRRNFFWFSVSPDRIPPGGKSQKYGDFSPFWPRTAPGTRRSPAPGPKTEKKHNLPVLGALLGGNPDAENVSPRKGAFLFTFYVLADRTPRAGDRKVQVFGAILAQDGPWHL